MIARNWSHLDPVRSLWELEGVKGIPVQMANEEFTGVWHLRETRALVDWLRGQDSRLATRAGLDVWLAGYAPEPLDRTAAGGGGRVYPGDWRLGNAGATASSNGWPSGAGRSAAGSAACCC